MEEELISFETAKSAKEKGFDLTTYTAYIGGKFHKNEDEPNGYDGYDLASKENWNKNGWLFKKDGSSCFGCQNNPRYFEACSAPTQSLLHRWLREAHEINIEATYLPNRKVYKSLFVPMDTSISNRIKYNPGSKYYGNIDHKTYEEALEEGLFEALKLIE